MGWCWKDGRDGWRGLADKCWQLTKSDTSGYMGREGMAEVTARRLPEKVLTSGVVMSVLTGSDTRAVGGSNLPNCISAPGWVDG